MAMTWISGTLSGVDIEWMHFEEVCPVNENKELLRTRVTAITEGLDGYGYFDLFQLLKNLTDEKATGSEVVFIPRDQVSAGSTLEIPVMGAVKEMQIIAAHIVPKQAITGDNTNYMTLKLVNKETAAVICTKTFTLGLDAAAYEVTDFGPVDEAAAAISLNKGVSFVKEETAGGMTLPQSILVIQWNLR